jgi:hypothetical protein
VRSSEHLKSVAVVGGAGAAWGGRSCLSKRAPFSGVWLSTTELGRKRSAVFQQAEKATMVAIMSPLTRRRVGVMAVESAKTAAADAAAVVERASAPSAECVYASAATGRGSVETRLQVGTVGLQVLRREEPCSQSATEAVPGMLLRPLRTLTFSSIKTTAVVAVTRGPLTGGHPSALIVEYRDGTAFTRLEKIFCFMATADANRINDCLASSLAELHTANRSARAALSSSTGPPSDRRTEMPAALVALMTTKTKARCGAKLWASMDARARSQAVQVMMESFALQQDASAVESYLGGRMLNAPSPSPRGRRSAAAKRGVKKLAAHVNVVRQSPTSKKAKSRAVMSSPRSSSHRPAGSATSLAETTGVPADGPTRVLEYVSDLHGNCAAF